MFGLDVWALDVFLVGIGAGFAMGGLAALINAWNSE